MKTMKKLMTLVLSIAMVLAMGVTAFADDATTYSITINNAATGHTYEAYQILTGDLTLDADGKVLSNLVWGSGVTDAGKTNLGDVKALTLKTSDDAAAFAKQVAKYLNAANVYTSGAQGNDTYTISGLPAGYYLVKDKDDTLKDADDFYTAYIMEVVGNVTASPKGNKPSLDKQIKHNEAGAWGVVGDNQIGDTVEFRTITTVPNTDGYTSYDYIIHDTMSAGLTSNVKANDDVTITVGENGEVLDSKYYTVTANGNSFAVEVDILQAIADGKMSAGGSLYTYYTGVLNENALIYDTGKQNNTAYLQYSNNPNNTDDKGETPKKKVYDWTFKMEVNKIAGDTKESLIGAKFVLSKNGGLGNLQEADAATTADLIALIANNDGTYTVAPADYTGTTTTVIEAGDVTIKGLDDAVDYYLYEIKAPSKYNKLETPTQFKITASYNEDGSAYTSVTVKVGGDAALPSRDLKINVENNKGSSLPSTGGMGTTIFYVVGTILVLAAVVLLITKKRMHANK